MINKFDNWINEDRGATSIEYNEYRQKLKYCINSGSTWDEIEVVPDGRKIQFEYCASTRFATKTFEKLKNSLRLLIVLYKFFQKGYEKYNTLEYLSELKRYKVFTNKLYLATDSVIFEITILDDDFRKQSFVSVKSGLSEYFKNLKPKISLISQGREHWVTIIIEIKIDTFIEKGKRLLDFSFLYKEEKIPFSSETKPAIEIIARSIESGLSGSDSGIDYEFKKKSKANLCSLKFAHELGFLNIDEHIDKLNFKNLDLILLLDSCEMLPDKIRTEIKDDVSLWKTINLDKIAEIKKNRDLISPETYHELRGRVAARRFNL